MEAAPHLSKKQMQSQVHQRHTPYKFKVREKVWLQAKQIKIHQQSSKLGPKQLGPFTITKVLSDVDYQLALCYVLVERSARLELDGYDSVVWHVALEACASSTL